MKLNYKEFGEGDQSLIIIHGLFGSLDNWLTLAKGFAKNQRVFLIDQRNHGRSPHSDDFTYEAMAGDVKEFIIDHNLNKVSLLGHSMGGKTAMLFACTYPELVDKLVIVDIGPKYYPPHHKTIIDALTNIDLQNLKSRSEADKIMVESIQDFGIRQFLLKNLTRNEDKQFAWKINLPVIVKNIDSVGEGLNSNLKYNGSTQFIRGDRSDYILDEDVDAIQTQFPNAQLVTIQGAGHWVHAEQPEALFNTITNFFNE
jgi:esterase